MRIAILQDNSCNITGECLKEEIEEVYTKAMQFNEIDFKLESNILSLDNLLTATKPQQFFSKFINQKAKLDVLQLFQDKPQEIKRIESNSLPFSGAF